MKVFYNLGNNIDFNYFIVGEKNQKTLDEKSLISKLTDETEIEILDIEIRVEKIIKIYKLLFLRTVLRIFDKMFPKMLFSSVISDRKRNVENFFKIIFQRDNSFRLKNGVRQEISIEIRHCLRTADHLL